MQVYLADFQETPPLRVKTYLLVDFILSKLEVQLASLIRVFGNPP